jgi:hypothetical protein
LYMTALPVPGSQTMNGFHREGFDLAQKNHSNAFTSYLVERSK